MRRAAYRRPFTWAGPRTSLPERQAHDLRLTAACLMFARGLCAEAVKDLLDHSSIAILVEKYRHWLPQTGQRAAAAMNAFPTRRGERASRHRRLIR